MFVVADVTNKNQIYQAFDETAKKFSKLNIVLNNAGMGANEKIITTDRESLEKEFDKLTMIVDVNLNAVIKVTMLAV